MVSGQYQHCQSVHLLLEHFALQIFHKDKINSAVKIIWISGVVVFVRV